MTTTTTTSIQTKDPMNGGRRGRRKLLFPVGMRLVPTRLPLSTVAVVMLGMVFTTILMTRAVAATVVEEESNANIHIVSLIDDFSDPSYDGNNALGQFRGGAHVDLNQYYLTITRESGHWTEVVASDGECKDLTGQALYLAFENAQAEDEIAIRFSQRGRSCEGPSTKESWYTYHTHTNSVRHVIIPLADFAGANPKRGYAFTIYGQVTLYTIGLVDAPWDNHEESGHDHNDYKDKEGEDREANKRDDEWSGEGHKDNEKDGWAIPPAHEDNDDHHPEEKDEPPAGPEYNQGQMKTYEKCARPGLFSLTYDDGPHPSRTDAIMDEAAKYGFHLTFFWVGQEAVMLDAVVQRAIAAQHVIASHTYTHSNLVTLTADKIRSEFRKTEEVLHLPGGKRPKFLRPPYGSINQLAYDIATKEFGYSVVLWNVDSQDWQDISEDKLVSYYTEAFATADPGTDSFIALNHDLLQKGAPASKRVFPIVANSGFQQVPMHVCLGQEPYQ